MQDVVPKGDRSIRNIPVPSSRRSTPPPTTIRPPEVPKSPRKRSRVSALWILVGAVLAALAGLVIASLFEGAKVTVTPRSEAVTTDFTLSASQDAPVGQLPYQLMKTERDVSRTLKATGEARVERRASGIITIYNEFSTQSQRLIKNTRFEAPDGKIYRINDSITVPGATAAAGGKLTAGTIDVTIYADSPGEAYNKEPTQFTIPGFKGDPRYSKFYARSKTALTGGFEGVERVVSDAAFTQAVEDMREELSDLLANAALGELPQGYLAVTGGTRLSFNDPVRENDGSDVKVTLSGSVSSVIVQERELAAEIAKRSVDTYTGEAVLFADTAAVQLATSADDLDNDPISISVSGNPTLVWQFDVESLRADLAGQERAVFESVIRTYEPEISRATASIRPFFKRTFPADPGEVTVVVEEAEPEQ